MNRLAIAAAAALVAAIVPVAAQHEDSYQLNCYPDPECAIPLPPPLAPWGPAKIWLPKFGGGNLRPGTPTNAADWRPPGWPYGSPLYRSLKGECASGQIDVEKLCK